MKRRIVAGVEAFLVVISIFAFCYFVGFNEKTIPLVSAESENLFEELFTKVKSGELVENSTWQTYSISVQEEGAGCCFINVDGQLCGTAIPGNCLEGSLFAEGSLCKDTSFCEKGCCYDEESGIYDKNVLKAACDAEWVDDPNCNLPGASLGCCVLGSETAYETLGQCEMDSLVRAIGDEEVVDWRDDVGEAGCLYLSAAQKEGACVLGERGCKFVTEADCFAYGGSFAEGYLCTSPSLNTTCEMTEQTTCVDGKDGVYFLDSCGNRANIYDSERTDDVNYWDKVVGAEDVCGATDFENGNADDPSCGNCDRFAGGICASAVEDSFDVYFGDFYCRDTSCMYDGEVYKNGESWCVYDGAVGNGNDVVGSRHWKYVCSQGVVQVEPCADYRNQICVQSEESGFDNAACVANNWRECINLNTGEKDAAQKCSEALNCRVDTISIADKFTFDVCLPKYPGGFDLTSERYQMTTESLCGMATQTCTVVRKSGTFGGCEIVANGGCLGETFAQEMNDFCRGLGDCGGEVNILGKYSGNYNVRGAPALSSSWIAKLISLAKPVDGQYAEVEDYDDYLGAAGFWGGAGSPGEAGEDEEFIDMNMVATGVGGIGTAASYFSASITSFFLSFQTFSSAGLSAGGYAAAIESTSATVAGFSSAAIGASIGIVVGSMLAEQLGLSSFGTMLMAIGGGMVGGALAYYYMTTAAFALGPVGWAGIAVMVIALFFSSDECPPIKVTFECRPWQPPVGGDDCEECNRDPLKPCSSYRCSSLGAGCELINQGTDDELCVSGNPNDVTPPVISRNLNFGGDNYIDDDDGFSIVGGGGGCLAAYEPLSFGVVTNEPAQCKFDLEQVEFDEMSYDVGSNSYLYNHTTTFVLPDPSHGQSQGINWTGDLTIYILCRDRYGAVSPDYYIVDMCVAEGDDRTAPKIVATEPARGSIFGVDTEEVDVMFVTNELSTCKWDFEDLDYSNMGNSFDCEDSLGEPSNIFGYVCEGTLPIENSTDYYVRCMDQPWEKLDNERNANVESFVFSLRKPEDRIFIKKIAPSEDFETSTDLTTIDLKIATDNGGDYHYCSYSFSGYDKMIEMFETGKSKTHEQTLNLGAGKKKIYIECRDETGDFVRNSTEFEIIRDSSIPQVARVWQNGGFVNLVLNEDAECKFSFDSCKFVWSEGNEIGTGDELRFAVVRGERYYIKCKDEFGNMPSGCSVEVVAT